MNHDTAMMLVDRELERARKKFPQWPGSESKQDILLASSIVGEEAGELIKAAVQFYGENGEAKACFDEAIQTAAMCFRFLEGK